MFSLHFCIFLQAAEKQKFGVEEVEGKTKNPQIHVK